MLVLIAFQFYKYLPSRMPCHEDVDRHYVLLAPFHEPRYGLDQTNKRLQHVISEITERQGLKCWVRKCEHFQPHRCHGD